MFKEQVNNLLISSNIDQMDAQSIQTYMNTLEKVNKKIKLTSFSPSWVTDHLEDCIQSYGVFIELQAKFFIDCGSGNGLPGIIYGILSKLPFILCDTDQRKCEFLKMLIYRLKLNGLVFNKSLLELEKKNFPEKETAFVYRGLGPDNLLIQSSQIFSKSMHFRMKSSAQPSLFPESETKKYQLSDKSHREIEIFVPRGTK